MQQTKRARRISFRKQLSRVFVLMLVFYVIACVGCAAFQRRLIYFPQVFNSAFVDQLARRANLERWTTRDGGRIGMKRLWPQQPSEGQLLITYGNGGSAVWSEHYADVIQQVAALDVFVVEYPGYADRAGSPSEKTLFRAAEEALLTLDTNKPIFLLGESLGTGVASYLAGKFPDRIAGVVLLAPYNRLADVAQYHMPLLPVRWLLVERFRSEDYLKNYRGPVGIAVAGQDRVVPEKFGRRLYDSYTGPKRLWVLPDGNHETVMLQPASFWKSVVGFWRTNRIPVIQTIVQENTSDHIN